MSYVRKLGASALVVAAAFAVAFAVLVSPTTTETVEAADVTVTNGTATVQPGDTAVITQAGRIVRFTIDGDNSTSTGSFASGSGQTIACSDDAPCDTGTEDADSDTSTPETDVADSITVKLDIDEDSEDGFIIVKYAVVITATGTVGDPTDAGTIVLTVTTQPKPASLSAKATSTTLQADPVDGPQNDGTDPDRTTITATVKNDQDPAVGMAGQTLTFITTVGNLDCDGVGTGDAPAQVCQADTRVDNAGTSDVNELGTVEVTLLGAGREGTSTITVTHATLDSATVEVTFYGDPDSVEAAAEQNSVEVGGSVLVVLTVKDAAGSPVKGQSPTAAKEDAIVGPAENANTISTNFKVNKLDSKGKVAIPACEAHDAVLAAAATAENPETLGSSGTNDDGQCVVQVTANEDDDTTANVDESSARGVNTLSFALNKLSASAEVEVAGPAASIESDAPGYVDPLSDTKIMVTVRDDEGVLVGATRINVIKVAGDGLTEGKATADDAMTTNGSSTFTYAAGLADEVVFRVIAGTGDDAVRDIITLTVGEPEVEEPPAEPSLDRTPSSTGFTLVNFSGGSVGELGDALAAQCGDGGRAYATDYLGRWVSYIPAAMMGPVNAAFEQLFPDGIPANTPLLVGGCSG